MPAKIIKCQSVFPQGSWAYIKMIQKFLTEFVGAFGFGWHMVHVFYVGCWPNNPTRQGYGQASSQSAKLGA